MLLRNRIHRTQVAFDAHRLGSIPAQLRHIGLRCEMFHPFLQP